MGVQDVVDIFMEKAQNGTPDISVERGGRKLFLIEAKFKKKTGRLERDIEPRDPAVIDQAVDYAVKGGFPYYATCNTKRLILFEFRPGVRAYESEIASFDFASKPTWASDVMHLALGQRPVNLKPADDSVVDTFREAFDDLYPEVLGSLRRSLATAKFRARYLDWLSSQGVEFTDENNSKIAEQTTYLQLNKLLFYKAVSLIYPDKLPKLKITEEEDVSQALGAFYSRVRKIDYQPIYQSDILTEIPLTERAQVRLRTLVDTLNEFDFSKVESDFVGRLYEKLIPALERKRLGQFYTPPEIVDFITKLTVHHPHDKVLDPGCGSGGFLVRAYHQLRELNNFPKDGGGLQEVYHQQLLNQVYGIDINQFPAHLSVVNLAMQSPRSRIKQVNVAVRDFFDTKPGIATLTGFDSITVEGAPTLVELPPTFDVVVANPPYIRQELVGEREKSKITKVVEGEYKDRVFVGSTAADKSKDAIVLKKQSDIYIYFVLHGLRFLRNNGFLGFITSDKWLSVEYGEPFQEFLMKYAKVLCIVEFRKAVFPELEVDTAVMILQKVKDETARDKNNVKFVRVKKLLPMNELISAMNSTPGDLDNEFIHIKTMEQGDLEAGKWSIYLKAPSIFHKIIRSGKVKPLEQVADGILYGTKTGNDDYFILSKQRAKELGIEAKFLRPCAPAGEFVRGLVIEPADIGQVFFMVHLDRSQLTGTNALKYIEHGERLVVGPAKRRKESKRLQDVETIRSRTPWYSLPEIDVPSVIFPMWTRHSYRSFLNKADAYANNYFIHVIFKEDPECMAAYLNSTVAELSLEVLGRQYSGMLHTMVYELRSLPCIDIANLSGSKKKMLKQLFYALDSAMKERRARENALEAVKPKSKKVGQKGLFEPTAEKALEKAIGEERQAKEGLDQAIFDILGLSNRERQQVKEGLVELRELRRSKTKGQ